VKKVTLAIAIVLGALCLAVASSAVAANRADIGATVSDTGYTLTFGDNELADDAWISDSARYLVPEAMTNAVVTSGAAAGKSRIAILNEALYPDSEASDTAASDSAWLCANNNCLVP
jgi:hypothetical protein